MFNLSGKLRQALDLYEAQDYRHSFPFLDYFRRETDKARIQELDTLIASAIRNRDTEVGFALPDEFNLAPDRYRLSRRHREESLAELSTEDTYDAIDQLDGWTDPLNQVKVEAFDLTDQLISEKKPLRSYVVGAAHLDVGGQSQDYALTAGAWFRIDQEYVDLVDRYVTDNINDLTGDLRLPTWDDESLKKTTEGKYGEERYNKWLGHERGYAVLDRDLYRGSPGVRVEICDLLTVDKKLICVKRMDGSDKMSHLFQQGSVSAEMIMINDDYRAKLMAKLHTIDPNAEFGSANDWTVVYAIATSKPGDLKNIMYFFSRAALKMHGESIKGRGFRVAIAKIDRITRHPRKT